jgi:uncharacterized delta-60 repeat protein
MRKFNKKIFLIGCLVCNVFGFSVREISAAAGDLDVTFEGDGKAITPIGMNTFDLAYAVAIQPLDSKIIVAGSVNFGDFALVRYNVDGSLDTSFDSDGKVITNLGATDEIYALAIQPDGKIVAAGTRGNNIALARYNADGSLDTSFDADGIVVSTSGRLRAVALQADGKIVVGGSVGTGATTDFLVCRFNSNGSLDTSFDGDGIATVNFVGTNGNNGANELAQGVVVQTDGKIVAAGGSLFGASGNDNMADYTLARFNSDGSLDMSFDVDGKVVTPITTHPGPGITDDFANDVILQTDGKIIAAGYSANVFNGYDFSLVRYNSDGSLDTAFDGDGKVVSDIGPSDSFSQITLQTDGKIVAMGTSEVGSNNSDFAVLRYNTNGSLDASFGIGGKVTTPLGSTLDYGLSGAIQPDGKIVVAVYSNGATNQDFAVARYLSSAPSAALASISGRIFSPTKQGLPRSTVVLTDSEGFVRTARTNSFGYYLFEEIPVGETYLIEVRHKIFSFMPQIIAVNDNISELNFIANSP